jgi:tetratricopeptide (TPR) repeat protein
MTRALSRLVVGLAPCLLSACVATLSEPRGEAHLAAMRDASRHYHHGRVEQAAEAWERAGESAERRVDRDEAEYREARALIRLARVEEALSLLDAIAARRPVSRRTVRAAFDAALERLARGDRPPAEATLLWIVSERPGDGPASRALALLLELRASQPAATRLVFLRDLYHRVGTTDLGDDVLVAEAELLRAEGDGAGEVRALERVVREHPYPHGQRWDDALFRLADRAEERGDPHAAIEYLSRMLAPHENTVIPGSQTAPRMPEARLRIARLYRDRLGDIERAAEHFERMASQFPTSRLRDDALLELGVMWLDRGRPAEGCAALARLLATQEVGHARRLADQRFAVACPR